jgi:hypothetical protein
MEPSVYNNDFLSKHTLYAYCASTLNAVSERDYPGKNYFDPQIACLDVDTYETSICQGEANCTTDAVIGISSCENKVLSEHRLLLVELRMKYQNANNLNKSEWERKVSHTKELLDGELTIAPQYIFVFTEKVAPQARHWMAYRKQEGGILRKCIVYSVREFRDNIRSVDDMPYIPIYSPDKVCEELNDFVKAELWNKMFDKLTFWLRKASGLRYSNTFEFESLQQTLKGWWKQFRAQHHEWNSEDNELNALIMDEDLLG